ncbi:MAG: outer membrane protein OmpA-like peptidoglycan-associated protein [Paraglaciecola sp.]|jgi:outer membrane protein OmpA-like peptidoglycan-associated protein
MKYINAIFFFTLLLFSGQLMAQDGGTEGVDLKNLETLNSEYEDFAPMPYGNKLMYTKATRKHKIFGPKLSNGTNRFTDVYTATRGADGMFGNESKLSGDVNYRFFDGAPTFMDGGQKMIYSRTNLNGRNQENDIVLKLYEADVTGDTYNSGKEKALPFNSDDFSNTHPALSKDGKWLFFSSNRPGGYGGMDLYVSENTDGTWGAPKNLGAAINTASNEIFPYADMNNNVFYSSDKSGNLDIYIAQMKADVWTMFGSLGAPFNSGADDINFVANADGTEGYLASAREGGKGSDDIYTWKYDPEPVEATIVVIDADTQERLESAKVMITPTAYGNILDELYREVKIGEAAERMTDADGKTVFKVYPESQYKIEASKENYSTEIRNPTTLELAENEEYTIPLKRTVWKRNLNGVVINSETNDPIVDSRVLVYNLTLGGDPIEYFSDKDGKFDFEIDCSHEFKIIAEKASFSRDTVELKDLLESCKNGDVSTTLKLTPAMRLVHVYFDFDKSSLRLDESLADLQGLKRILMDNANYTAELRGHTDSRGRTGYNKTLSVRRAKAVVKWLVDNGLDKNRLVAVGLGETQLVNNCGNGVPCSELEHQLNRRTEFTLISKIIEIKEINSSGLSSPRVDPCKGCPHEPQP